MKPIRKPYRGFGFGFVQFAVGLALASPALANPNGAAVVSGQATFQVNGKTLTITNTPGAIINWQGFSIRADELTRFLQQSPVSTVLNRVVSASPSEILGRLQSNGRVFIVNPNGIAFGPGSQVDVAGFAASTLNISNADFASGRHVFSGTGAEGRIVNKGEIVTPAGGRVFLIAPQVENTGIIRAPSGEIVLAAGNTVRLVDANFPSIHVEVSAGGKDVPLGGLAGTGRVFAYLVKQAGVVSASAASVGDGGRVSLKSAGDVQVAAGSRTEAFGASGGSVVIQAAQLVAFSGAIDVRGQASSGGSVQVEAREQIAFSGTIDARSVTAKGGSAVVEAPRAVVAYAGNIDVSGARGGGTVAVLAEQLVFSGTIVARALQAGDGGAVEVSGRQALVFSGSVDTRAASGKDGTLLIDPTRITVVAGSTGMPPALADGTWAANEDAGAQTVGAADLTNLLRTTSVTLQATDSIVVAADAAIESNVAGRALTLQAPTVVFQGVFRAVQASADLNIRATTAQVTQAARIELGGGRLEVSAQVANLEPAVVAQRPSTQESMQRAAATTPPEVARLRDEVLAEIARDNARLAEAMSQSCAKAGAPRQGCTVATPARRFAFSG